MKLIQDLQYVFLIRVYFLQDIGCLVIFKIICCDSFEYVVVVLDRTKHVEYYM